MNQHKNQSNTHWFQVCITCVYHTGIRLKSMVFWFEYCCSLQDSLREYTEKLHGQLHYNA